MRFISTRGEDEASGLMDVAWRGLGRDGGLFVPLDWPKIDEQTVESLRSQPYDVVAARLFQFFGADELDTLDAMIAETYRNFRHKSRAPLVQIGPDEWILELFHGPTLAFKDFAMCWLAVLLERLLQKKGERLTILCATSGDTGAAAVAAFAHRKGINLIVLFPEGRISPTQQKQITTQGADNCLPIAIKGDFDDCQRLVKETFSNLSLRERYNLTAVNSINFARIMPQMVYYLTAALSLGAPAQLCDFIVPSGNFGHAYAGWMAKQMGLPIGSITAANNQNNIITRCFASGDYRIDNVSPTTSPSMDIQVASNFERLLFEAEDRDPSRIRLMMSALAETGGFSLTSSAFKRLQSWMQAGFATEEEVRKTQKDVWQESGYLLDPHSAVGVAVSRKKGSTSRPRVTLATAHPGKFSDAVNAALGQTVALPDSLAALDGKKESYRSLDNHLETLTSEISHWIDTRDAS